MNASAPAPSSRDRQGNKMRKALVALAVVWLASGCTTTRTAEQMHADMDRTEQVRRVLSDPAFRKPR